MNELPSPLITFICVTEPTLNLFRSAKAPMSPAFLANSCRPPIMYPIPAAMPPATRPKAVPVDPKLELKLPNALLKFEFSLINVSPNLLKARVVSFCARYPSSCDFVKSSCASTASLDALISASVCTRWALIDLVDLSVSRRFSFCAFCSGVEALAPGTGLPLPLP